MASSSISTTKIFWLEEPALSVSAPAVSIAADNIAIRGPIKPTATQVSPTELQDVFQETSSNIFQINGNGTSQRSFVTRMCL
ncbi:UNVERIFIED_CONTAM: hypothetical protein FKN15_038153 [Acipenser sinensis]